MATLGFTTWRALEAPLGAEEDVVDDAVTALADLGRLRVIAFLPALSAVVDVVVERPEATALDEDLRVATRGRVGTEALRTGLMVPVVDVVVLANDDFLSCILVSVCLAC